jgi:tryptophanyl-tRNA synthetase
MFNAHKVPVGRDQIQHLEMARDIAQRFNHQYGQGHDFFVMPEAQVDDEVATLPGLDGRKMSKSYDNTIPLFEGGYKAMRSAVMRIVTDSRQPGEPKDADSSHLYALYRAFSTTAQSSEFRHELEDGLGWGEAKDRLCDRIESSLAPMRERYAELMATPEHIEDVLQAGADKARKQSSAFIARLREAVGLRSIRSADQAQAAGVTKKGAAKRARFVSFRDEAGQFRFRLLSADGKELLLSEPFADPKAAGAAIKHLQTTSLSELPAEQDGVVSVRIGDAVVCQFSAVDFPAINEAVATLSQD